MKNLLLVLAIGGVGVASGCGGGNAITIQRPSIISAALPSGATGAAYAGGGFSLAASGGVAPYTWSWAPAAGSALPPGLAMSNDGFISGTPTTAGTYNVVITVTDSETPAEQAITSYAIKVAIGPPTVTSGAPPSGTVGSPYAGSGFPLAVSGGTAPFTWSWAAAAGSALPPGLTLSNATISGTPTAAGSYGVVLTVTDSQSPPAQGTAPYTITIGPALTIISGNPPDGVAGSTYNSHRCPANGGNVACGGFQLFAQGGVPPYRWSWTGQPGSSTPPGLGIHFGGACPGSFIYHDTRIACVPTTAGTYNVVVTVTDSSSPPNQTSNNYTINITNPPPPNINTIPVPSAGAVNLPYDFRFTTTGGLAPLTWSETGAPPPGLNFASDGTLSGTPTATGSFPITVNVVDSLSRSASPQDFTIQVALHGFKATGSMSVPRVLHTATLLKDGRVFVAGGANHVAISVPSGVYVYYASTETYDPNTRSFSSTASMASPRFHHTATLLNSGKVLVAGGEINFGFITPTAEIYDPSSNSFSPTNNMTTMRWGHQATVLASGKVLITGGSDGTACLDTAELYDPASGTFSSTGKMSTGRCLHTQTALDDGTALVAGGVDNANNTLGTAEIFDPASGTFSTPINMSAARLGHTATLLNSGKVLLTGGLTTNTGTTVLLSSTDVFDPSKGTFNATGGSANARTRSAAALLGDGTVLVAGGITDTSPSLLALAEIYDPTTGKFTGTGSLVTPRSDHTATSLQDGTVLVVGGADIGGLDAAKILSSAETYQ